MQRPAPRTLVTALLASAAVVATLVVAAGASGGRDGKPVQIARQGHFFVGADYVADHLANQMYVQYQVPQPVKHPYPIILVHGGGGQGLDWFTTPDGRPGWATLLLQDGYTVYMVDRPAFGRSPNNNDYGPLGASTSATQIQNNFTAPEKLDPLPWPQAAKHTQWPGTGLIGDPAFTAFLASQNPGPTVGAAVLKENMAELLDTVGPAILMTHSAGVPSGWLAVDARPHLVKGVVAIEGGATPSPTEAVYSPAGPATTVSVPSTELPDLLPCNLQAEPAKTLVNFVGLPVLAVAAEASSQTRMTQCSAKYINQAGGNADLLRLEQIGIHGNGHIMMGELNNAEILEALIDRIQEMFEGRSK